MAGAALAVVAASRLNSHMEGIERSILDDGLRVVTEGVPGVRSVALAYWVGIGARDEPEELAGASHFLEHLLFKGTPSRSAAEIARAIESVGGEMNAFTSNEYTAYYVRVLDEHLNLALEILSDVVWTPVFAAEEFESERQVILEEIHSVDDDPDELVHEAFVQALYPEHPLGRSILGTPESIAAMGRDAVAAYHEEHYRSPDVVFAAAGNLSHDAIVEWMHHRQEGKADGGAEGGGGGRTQRRSTSAPSVPMIPLRVLTRKTEQAHLVLGMPALSTDDPDRYALEVVNHVFGGGMSSRLFQEVRERRGLAYSISSHRGSFRDAGYLAISAGAAANRVDELLSVVHAELDRLRDDGCLQGDELSDAKGYLRGALALGLEDPSSRMSRIGRSELVTGEIPTFRELVARIDAVTPDDVARVIQRVFGPRRHTLAVVGPFDEAAFDTQVA